MFTGIVQAKASIIAIKEQSCFRTHCVIFPKSLLSGLTIGASVSNNGCCLTVANIVDNIVSFDIIQETIRLTNLGELKVKDEINLERSVSLQSEIGGHLMSGHITCTAELHEVISLNNSKQIWFVIPNKALMKYIFYKGYIGIDGISLTVGEIIDNKFCVHLIPETLLRTTLGTKLVGDKVNIEIDSQTQATVDTVEKFLISQNLLKSL